MSDRDDLRIESRKTNRAVIPLFVSGLALVLIWLARHGFKFYTKYSHKVTDPRDMIHAGYALLVYAAILGFMKADVESIRFGGSHSNP